MPTLTVPDPVAIRNQLDADTLPRVFDAADQIETLSVHIGALETKLHRQYRWLLTHRDHPNWTERRDRVLALYQEREEALHDLYQQGTALDRRIHRLSAAGRRQAAATLPGVTDGIDFMRRRHYHHSPMWGKWIDVNELGVTDDFSVPHE